MKYAVHRAEAVMVLGTAFHAAVLDALVRHSGRVLVAGNQALRWETMNVTYAAQTICSISRLPRSESVTTAGPRPPSVST